MIVAKVIDTLISTRKHETLQGVKLLIVKPVKEYGGDVLLVGDLLGAGIGEYVMVTRGSAASKALASADTPVDAMVIGILDHPPVFKKKGE